jgi:hypothetical protein
MHDNRKLKTLLACIDDLTHTVDEMAASEPVHQADQDLLLYHARRLYEALLRLETTVAIAPVAPNVDEKTEEVADLAVIQGDEGSLVEALSAQVEAAVEEAMESGEQVEVDIHLGQAAAVDQEQEQRAAEPVESTDALEEGAAGSSWEATDEPQQVADAAAEGTPPKEVASTPQPVAAEAPQMEEVVARAEAHASTPAETRSFAFSLTGIIEKSGESQLVMAHLKLKPIDDLKSGIGLNEKFLFIRELFGNDHMAYAEAIEKLNQADGIAAAEQVLAEDILPKQQWDLDTEAALSFLHLIYRRFAKNA